MTPSILFIGEGERDKAVVPPIVTSVLKLKFHAEFEQWSRIHLRSGTESRGNEPGRFTSTKGIQRKLAYGIRRAIDRNYQGVVATIDGDKMPNERRRDLKVAREVTRERIQLSTAIGVPDPHLEAWLIDDAQAVDQCLQLGGTDKVPSVQDCKYPKDDLTHLHSQSLRAENPAIAICEEIAALVDHGRCRNPEKTGFFEFVADLESEFRSMRRAG